MIVVVCALLKPNHIIHDILFSTDMFHYLKCCVFDARCSLYLAHRSVVISSSFAVEQPLCVGNFMQCGGTSGEFYFGIT